MKILAIIVILISFAVAGCSPKLKPDMHPNWKEVPCSECNGTGKVTYDKDHPFVQHGLCEPGTYTCSICQGQKVLIEELRP